MESTAEGRGRWPMAASRQRGPLSNLITSKTANRCRPEGIKAVKHSRTLRFSGSRQQLHSRAAVGQASRLGITGWRHDADKRHRPPQWM